MMESALSGVGLTLDGLRHALLRCELSVSVYILSTFTLLLHPCIHEMLFQTIDFDTLRYLFQDGFSTQN